MDYLTKKNIFTINLSFKKNVFIYANINNNKVFKLIDFIKFNAINNTLNLKLF